ncbi:AAA family ATPase [Larkinella terrae]|uniref:AAA family ATPase n=1 Tax=Larkinella terrae TaxID=2025311 RepID=A0A7K0EN86_9BACT|nr:AAA family ATPase [Larkinella terrae]MRS63310.1 AAA family ATPase [Larkinella terrae]
MRIHIMGASGAGSTTFGRQLAQKLAIPYFDSDDFFWIKTEPPYQNRRHPDERNRLCKAALAGHPDCILGGSVSNWGDGWENRFDLVVFLRIPPEIRIERLRKREFERFGDVILTDGERRKTYEEFIEWAAGYDNDTAQGRTLSSHLNWLRKVTCPVLTIEGDTTVTERMERVLEVITKS